MHASALDPIICSLSCFPQQPSCKSFKDVCSLCNRGRLELVATDVLKRKQVYISDYRERQDVIDANMCSIHIPVFLDFKPFAYHE